MTRRTHNVIRCRGCGTHLDGCICDQLPRLVTRTRLVLVIHQRETYKPSNTGKLAVKCLTNSQTVMRGDRSRVEKIEWPADSQPLLLFPHADATPLTEWIGCTRPITLIVPDATWRQAARVRRRVPELAEVPCVSLPAGEPSRYFLRTTSQPRGLATIEAVARAMGLLEDAEIERALDRVFQIMVERTLSLRGQLERRSSTACS